MVLFVFVVTEQFHLSSLLPWFDIGAIANNLKLDITHDNHSNRFQTANDRRVPRLERPRFESRENQSSVMESVFPSPFDLCSLAQSSAQLSCFFLSS